MLVWKQATEVSAKNQKRARKKRTALVICHDGKLFWTTQVEFWQWVRDCVVVKLQDQPLTGTFRREDEELEVLKNHTVLNLSAPNHLREVMMARHSAKKTGRTRLLGK